MPDTETQFQRVITTFLFWEAATEASPDVDPEAAECAFLAAMRAFVTPEIGARASCMHPPIVTSTQPRLADGVQLQGQLYDFPVDLAALLAEGWTSLQSLRVQGTPCVVLESRTPMATEEAEARAMYARLKLRFEGR